jgi:hypothetical protein
MNQQISCTGKEVVAKRKSYQQEWVDLSLWRLARGGREGLVYIRPCQSASIHQQTAIFEARISCNQVSHSQGFKVQPEAFEV